MVWFDPIATPNIAGLSPLGPWMYTDINGQITTNVEDVSAGAPTTITIYTGDGVTTTVNIS